MLAFSGKCFEFQYSKKSPSLLFKLNIQSSFQYTHNRLLQSPSNTEPPKILRQLENTHVQRLALIFFALKNFHFYILILLLHNITLT